MELSGKGSIQQLDKGGNGRKPRGKCRKWRLWQTADGKRMSRRFEGTYSEAQGALQAFRAELAGTVPNGELFASYAAHWRDMRASMGSLDSSTLRNDARNVRTLCRVFGSVPMDAMTPERVREGIAGLRNGGGASGRVLSGTYLSNVFSALSSMMQQAADDGRIAANPCASVEAPKPDTQEREALTVAQMDALYSALDSEMRRKPHGRYPALLIMLDCGLRSEEALALRPEDVDTASRMVHVRHALKDATHEIGKTKSKAGVRSVPMTERLSESCAFWDSVRRRWLPESETFCCSASGGILYGGTLRRWWMRNRGRLGCSGFTIHQLRHSNLTKMARYMSPFDLKRWAGWSSLAPAMVYVHEDMDALKSAVAASESPHLHRHVAG